MAAETGSALNFSFTAQNGEKNEGTYLSKLYNSDYKLKYNKDKLIMLVGSSSVYPDFKFVAVGVLNGKAQVNAKANDQIQYPQAWYDKNNQSNPYRFSIGWYPTVYSDSSEKETAVLSARDY